MPAPTSRTTPATQEQVLAATRQWLRPVIRVLLRCGITWRVFADLAKTTYVEVAMAQFGRRGRPTNVSRTAVLTGLLRREVRKQRDLLEGAPVSPSGYVTKASLVLSAWHLDEALIDRKGRPIPLRAEGFASLVQRCAGTDVPATTLLKELISAGAVRERADGRFEVLKRNYIPQELDAQLIRLWGSVLADVAITYAHNLSRTGRSPPRFERAAVNDRIDATALPAFRKFLEAEGQGVLERVDAWLTEHQVPTSTEVPEAKILRLGAGVYHIQDE